MFSRNVLPLKRQLSRFISINMKSFTDFECPNILKVLRLQLLKFFHNKCTTQNNSNGMQHL